MNTSQDNREIIGELVAVQEEGESVALATIVKASGSVPRHAGAKMLIYPDGVTKGSVGGGEMESRVVQEAMEALNDGVPKMISYSLVDPAKGDPGICGGTAEIYVEPYLPPATVLIVGCGHVGRAVANIADWLGYVVAVTDDREELVIPEEIPGADYYLKGEIEEVLEGFKVNQLTYIVMATRNADVDRKSLPHLLDTPAPYIGVIGSRRRWEETKKLLRVDGLTEEEIRRFHSPIGLDLQAETPEEIAISILAEVIMVRKGGSGRPMAALMAPNMQPAITRELAN
jgi:xanthine dehydrogenase accessory factor